MKIPDANHPISIEDSPVRVKVTAGGKTVADSRDALVLREANYKPVYYIPRKDVEMALLEKTSHSTHCPYKGDASYFTIDAGDHKSENAIWSYEDPYPSVAAIKDHVAFYPNRVDRIEELAS